MNYIQFFDSKFCSFLWKYPSKQKYNSNALNNSFIFSSPTSSKNIIAFFPLQNDNFVLNHFWKTRGKQHLLLWSTRNKWRWSNYTGTLFNHCWGLHIRQSIADLPGTSPFNSSIDSWQFPFIYKFRSEEKPWALTLRIYYLFI